MISEWKYKVNSASFHEISLNSYVLEGIDVGK